MAGDAPLSVFWRGPDRDHQLTLYRKGEFGDELVSPFVKVPGVVPQPFYTIDDLLAQGPPFPIAHRCGGGDWPEFSAAGINGSISRGYIALELSVYECATGEFVCSHDWTTQRMTGVNYQIMSTSWATLSTLTSTAAGTSDPSQPGQPLLRLEDVLALAPDAVWFLDHKETSSRENPDQWRLDSEARLLDWVEANVPNATDRVVWKVFAQGYGSRERAAARGFQSWGIYYEDDLADPSLTEHLDEYELLGMEWNASQSAWNTVLAEGVPVVGHIIGTVGQAVEALSKGANGLMVSIPKTLNP